MSQPHPLPPIALPGQPLAPSPPYTSSTGTHIHTQNPTSTIITASIAGIPHLHPDMSISITRPSPSSSSSSTSHHRPLLLLPEVTSTVLARVTRLNLRQATVEIFAMQAGAEEMGVCEHTFQGIIRGQDVRATEKDRVKILESFRVGDVISLGDQSNYYLSTASNSLGVVVAHSGGELRVTDAGDPLHPINWRQMACARTGVVEDRKVAKPI
ncbi:exosome component EXOSC1/CSL4-domain-containing protein [Tuber borchii]|uniref:Exosome component EXOSC1/CSL4-domain-containing protein n=1 Tax=Tuber borchii TaxID=42251 RepID=A0A2T7A181_TUBBO|nr:exosome component EXOSC1/CSL4-domain-containing protein [Tuber borchii]